MEIQNIVLEASELLDKYYDERALSCLPNGYDPFFQFSNQIEWGYDLIEEVNGKPSCLPVPKDKQTLEGVFHTSTANFSYIGGKIIVTANISAGTLPDGAQHQFSAVGLKDTKGNYILISVTQPVWVYSHRGISLELTIHTARSDKAQAKVGA